MLVLLVRRLLALGWEGKYIGSLLGLFGVFCDRMQLWFLFMLDLLLEPAQKAFQFALQLAVVGLSFRLSLWLIWNLSF
jgi:hypothetical protein